MSVITAAQLDLVRKCPFFSRDPRKEAEKNKPHRTSTRVTTADSARSTPAGEQKDTTSS